MVPSGGKKCPNRKPADKGPMGKFMKYLEIGFVNVPQVKTNKKRLY